MVPKTGKMSVGPMNVSVTAPLDTTTTDNKS